MQRVLVSAFLLLVAGWADAQTIKITTANGPCTYPTGAVKSDPAVPGQLLATATGAGAGTGCGSGTSAVSFGPAAPLAPSTQKLASSGGTPTLTFQAVNATQCNGTITGVSGGTFSNGTGTANVCNSAASCALPISVATSFPANTTTSDIDNTVKVTCTDGSTNTSSQVTVTVGKTGTVSTPGCQVPPTLASTTQGIPNFSRWTGNQTVTYLQSGTNSAIVDVTSFDAVYAPWPGLIVGQTAILKIPTNKYAALQFKVPTGFSSALNGEYALNQSAVSAPVSMSISESCGDFSNPSTSSGSTVVPGCLINKGTTSNSYLIYWQITGTGCVLSPDKTYYLNIINADISALQPNGGGTAASVQNSHCTGGTCADPIANGPGNWGGQ